MSDAPETSADPAAAAAIAATRAWVEGAVIGLDLCPFAAAVWRAGTVRVWASGATSHEDAVRDGLLEAVRLLDSEADTLATTLIVLPHALGEFLDFLDAAGDLEEALEQSGAGGVLQLATFHPDYRFEGEACGDAAAWTNRAPYPVFHLLREADVSEAIERHPDPEGIPAANVERLRALGPEQLRALWAGWAR